jgi:hypothetical protein
MIPYMQVVDNRLRVWDYGIDYPGDSDVLLVPGRSRPVLVFSYCTADRVVNLSSTEAKAGNMFRIVNKSTMSIVVKSGDIEFITLPAPLIGVTYADVMYDGFNWCLIGNSAVVAI